MSVKTLYNPAALPKEELVANFVVRTKVFEKIFNDIKSSDMKYPEKHYLVQGQRGMGKTTLLLRLKYEVENTPTLNSWLVPVFFGEESYDLTSLSRLWEKLLEYLDDEWDTGGIHYDHTEDFVDFDDYEKRCFEYLIETLKANGKKIILFFDNFGQLFLDNLKEKEKRRLREVLVQCSDIRIIGASAIVMQDLHKYSEPFYEFFNIVYLEGLNKEETFQLIERLQENCEEKIDLKKNKAKIETLAILTGGVIRTLMMVYQVLLDDHDGSALNDLEVVLDQVTPLYKHRIEDLPIQQRRIVDIIAKRWDAVSAKEIAAQIREDGKSISTKLISAHLQQLEKNNVIEKKSTDTKNNLYQLKERFLNIWYLMRNGDRKDRRRVVWLTKFLELWYDDEEGVDSFLKKHIELLKTGKYHAKSALMIVEALINSDKINPMKLDQLVEETSAILDEEGKAQLPDINSKKFAAALRRFESGQTLEAIALLDSIKVKKSQHYIFLSFLYLQIGEVENGISCLQKVSSIVDHDLKFLTDISFGLGKPKLLLQIIDNNPNLKEGKAYKAKGDVFFQTNAFGKAKENYRQAIAKGESSAYMDLAMVHNSQGDFEEAENLLSKGIETGAISLTELLEYYVIINRNAANVEKARKLLVQLPENDAEYHFYTAMILMYGSENFLEHKEDVIPNLEKAVALYPKKKTYLKSYLLACSLLFMYYTDITKDKAKATKLASSFPNFNRMPIIPIYIAFVKVWNGDYALAKEILLSHAISGEIREGSEGIEHINDVLLLFIARNQFHTVLDLFKEYKNLKEMLKPTYYALMTFLKKEYPNEMVKMGEELNGPVNDILERIEEMKEEYK